MSIDESEIKAVAYVLQLDHDGKSVEQVAEECIKALHSLHKTAVRQSMGPLVVGECFRTAYGGPYIVAWNGHQYSWLINKTDTRGLITHSDSRVWRWREPARITDGVRIKATTNADGHEVGDMFMIEGKPFPAVSVCMNGVLVDDNGEPFAISNDEIERFYRKVG